MAAHCYEYPRPALTADVVCLHAGRILLIRRAAEPFAGCWALPGGFVDPGEDARQAAARELEEETGIRLPDPPFVLDEVGAFTAPGRDPRGWVVSVAFRCELDSDEIAGAAAADDAAELAWHSLAELPELAFDHAQVIERALCGGRIVA